MPCLVETPSILECPQRIQCSLLENGKVKETVGASHNGNSGRSRRPPIVPVPTGSVEVGVVVMVGTVSYLCRVGVVVRCFSPFDAVSH